MKLKTDFLPKLTRGEISLTQALERWHVPGATLAVVSGGEIVFSAAYGMRDGKGTPMTEGTLLECASLTKSLFALLALQEADAGKLALDRPIMDVLREEPWSDDPRFLTITPRQALCHASGLPNWEAKPMHMLFDPGRSFSYSGEGYYLLQHLVEQIEGRDMNALFEERFFRPWGMEHASACWTPAVGEAFSVGFDREGKVRKVRSERRTTGNGPEPNAAWSLYSYSGEYAKILCRLIRERGGLSQELFDEMTAPQNAASAQIDWGLGFGIPKKDPNVLWHWGDNSGFQSFAIWDKVTGDGMVVHTNGDAGREVYFPLLEQALDGGFWGDIRDFVEHAE